MTSSSKVTKKSGKGNSHGFVSEVSVYSDRQAGSRGGGARGLSPLRRDAAQEFGRREGSWRKMVLLNLPMKELLLVPEVYFCSHTFCKYYAD